MATGIESELQRYVAHLQSQLLTEGSEFAHDPHVYLTWVKSNRARMVAIAAASGLPPEAVDAKEAQLNRHEPASRFDSGVANAIFRPVLEDVLRTGERIGLNPVRPVLLANSTDISTTPLSRPSAVDHLVFAGVGTFAFCNYWAKILSQIARLRIPRDPGHRSALMADSIPR